MNADCPVCGKEMREGFVQSGTRLAWVPELSKWSVEPDFSKGAVLLSKQSRFSINHVPAYLCEECKRVVIEYE